MGEEERKSKLEKTEEEVRQEDLRRLQEFRLLDDTYARSYFRQQPELAEFVLRIITQFKDLEIDRKTYETQYDAKRLAGSRSLVMDVFAGDNAGRKYNFEVENWNAGPERGEVHAAAMVFENLHASDKFEDLPEIYVIFLTSYDAIGNGRAVNAFSFRNDDRNAETETHASMNGKLHIMYVNGDYEDEESEIGKLIHDFRCADADDMYYSNLAERTRYLKENRKGVEEMCKAMEDMRKENFRTKAIEIAKNFLALGKNTHEEIAEATGLTLEDVKLLAGQIAS